MKKLFLYLVPVVMIFTVLSTFSCSDDNDSLPRLFRPSFVKSMCMSDSDTIMVAWRTTAEATSYTVQISTDSLFSDNTIISQTVNSWKCQFLGLPLKTTYYVRARANNEAENLFSNWSVLETPLVTDSTVVIEEAKKY